MNNRSVFTTVFTSLLLMFLLLAVPVSAQVCNQNFSLGNDTTLNCGSSLTIQAPSGFPGYLWNTGATNSSINVSQAGTYWCTATVPQASIVVNGDFSQGYTGFTSDYMVGSGGTYGQLTYEGTYAVSSNSSLVHTNFASCFDHTFGNSSGSMMIVNGAALANQAIWRQQVPVQPNTTYIFSVWGMSVVSANPGQLNFSINQVQVGNTFVLSTSTCNWQNFFITWNSGSNTTADIAIVNQNTNTSGNDFAIDDILFAPVCVYSDTVVVSAATNPVLTLTGNDSICQGDSVTLTASSTIPGSSFIWQPGGLTGSQITVAPSGNIQYTAIAISPQGCYSAPKSITVHVFPVPVITASDDDSICTGSQVILSATANTGNVDFVWSPGSVTGQQVTVTPLSTTTYVVSGTSQEGCTSSDSVTVVVRNLPQAAISGDSSMCPGDSVILTATGPSGATYQWAPGSGTTASITVAPAITTTYSVVVSDGYCTSAPAAHTVSLRPVPVISVPEDITVCPGESVPAQVSADIPGSEFVWQPGDLSGSGNILVPDSTVMYSIYAVAEGCTSSVDSFTIAVNDTCNCELSVPNVFTPNGDGYNEYYKVITEDCSFTGYSFTIFNRWGMQVWTSNNAADEWDGTHNGTHCTPGTYFWVIDYMYPSGTNTQTHKTDKGSLSLFR